MADHLFDWMDALWTKARPVGRFPAYVAHRFLASDRELAPFVRALMMEVREPDLLFATWQGLLPHDSSAPRLPYGAPKKGPQAEELTKKMMLVRSESRETVEASQELVALSGRTLELYREYGVEPPESLLEEEVDTSGRRRGKKRRRKKEEPGGLLNLA